MNNQAYVMASEVEFSERANAFLIREFSVRRDWDTDATFEIKELKVKALKLDNKRLGYDK